MTASVRGAGDVFKTDGTATTDFELAIPSGAEIGDLLVAILVFEDGGDMDITQPDGWTILSADIDNSPALPETKFLDGNDQDLQIWTKMYETTDSSTITFTDGSSHHGAGVVIAIQNAGAIDNFVFDANGGTTSTPTCPDITSGEASIVLRVYGAEKTTNNSTPSGVPADHTSLVHTTSGTSSTDDILIGVAYETQNSAGAAGTAAFSISDNESWHGASLAISLTTLYEAEETTISDDNKRARKIYPAYRRPKRLGTL